MGEGEDKCEGPIPPPPQKSQKNNNNNNRIKVPEIGRHKVASYEGRNGGMVQRKGRNSENGER